jgi:AcrR family transcriptional regulator
VSPRPKEYDRDAIITAARDLFWEQGYQATSITDLERHLGLSRSSIYQEFGSKHGLFEAALDCYADRVIAGLFESVRAEGAGLDAIVSLFICLSNLFRGNAAVSTRGCLMVNAAAELAARDESVRPAATRYRDRLRADFAAALTRAARDGDIDPATVRARSHLLASALMGVWLTVRIDPADASRLCKTIAGEVSSWASRKPPSRSRTPKTQA